MKAKASSSFLTIVSFSWFKKYNPDQVLGFLKVFSFSYQKTIYTQFFLFLRKRSHLGEEVSLPLLQVLMMLDLSQPKLEKNSSATSTQQNLSLLCSHYSWFPFPIAIALVVAIFIYLCPRCSPYLAYALLLLEALASSSIF